jgi:hypothetical protein
MKSLLALLLLGTLAQTATAGYMYIKLVDERETLIEGAKFYWKYPNEQSYRKFGDQGVGSIAAYSDSSYLDNYSHPFNYRIGKSTNPDRSIDLKIVAPGYELHQWSQTWPTNNSPQFKTIVLERLRHSESYGKKQEPRSEKAKSNCLPQSLADEVYGEWWLQNGRNSATRLAIDKAANCVAVSIFSNRGSREQFVENVKWISETAFAVRMPLGTPGSDDGVRYDFTFSYDPRSESLKGSFQNNSRLIYRREKPFFLK